MSAEVAADDPLALTLEEALEDSINNRKGPTDDADGAQEDGEGTQDEKQTDDAKSAGPGPTKSETTLDNLLDESNGNGLEYANVH